MKFFMQSFILSAVLLTSSIPGFSSEAFARDGKRKGGGMGKILKQLDLSEDQKEQLKTIRKDNKKMGKADKGKIKELWGQMKSKFGSDASESEVRALHEQIKNLKMEKMEKRFSRIMKIRTILTVEQRKKFQSLRDERKKGKRKGRHSDFGDE